MRCLVSGVPFVLHLLRAASFYGQESTQYTFADKEKNWMQRNRIGQENWSGDCSNLAVDFDLRRQGKGLVARTVSLQDVFIENNKCAIVCRVLEERFNNCELDCERVLEVEKGREYVKTQGWDFCVFYHKVPGNFDEDGFGNIGKRSAPFLPVQYWHIQSI